MNSETDRPEPIDADFEPAPARLLSDRVNKTSPGWLAFGLLGGGMVGALALAIAAYAGNGSGAPASLAGDMDALVEAQRATEDQLASVASDMSNTETRLQREMQALLTGDDNSEGLEALVADLNTVSEQLDEAMTGGADSGAVAELVARVQTLEEADDGEAVSPRQMNRAVTALRERVITLEAVNQELLGALEVRGEAIAGLTTRIAETEFALEDIRSATGSAGLTEAAQTNIDDLQAAIAQLRADTEALQSGEISSVAAIEETRASLRDTGMVADAALALSSIEAAARRGNAFRSAYAKLSAAMPDEPAVGMLADVSVTGAPTLSDLRTRFVGDRDAALATKANDTNDGWGWVRTVFGDGVKVRRSGASEGPLATSLSAAETALNDDDIAGAIVALSDLEGDAAEAMDDWLIDAQKRAVLEDALDRLRLKMIGAER